VLLFSPYCAMMSVIQDATKGTLPGSLFGMKGYEQSGEDERGKQASRPMVVYLV
jgi:hypothetical protein